MTQKYEDAKNGWFALRTDGSRMGRIKEELGGFTAAVGHEGRELSIYTTKEAAWDAIAGDD
ncbi:hypothetical protein ABC270_13280 [Curtobacterium sp. 1P10AnD]|uniref:hypothetical protein n=1 Tax=Curtobacterium sp. 1P10AnD TaxID=3132283 RepID=UPI00399F7FAB